MFGQAFPSGALGFFAGAPVLPDARVDVELVGVRACAGAAVVAAVLCVVGDADALVMPAAAPAVASAPATIVAPSILEMVMGSNLLGWVGRDIEHRARRR